MNLRTLARKAANLPDLDFDWAGIEQFHSEVFERSITDLPSVIGYILKLKERISEQSFMLHELAAAYMKLKDMILEAEIHSV